MASEALIDAVAVTAELCGRVFSEPAARVFVRDLEGFPEEAILAALSRCRKEVRGVLTVSDVISRIDDGRPGAEEAWAMIPRDEWASVVWTTEMAEAFGSASGMLVSREEVPARMAFKEVYSRLVAKARDQRVPVRWIPSLGHDPGGREAAVMEAAQKGRIKLDYARSLVPSLQATPEWERLLAAEKTRLLANAA